LDVDTSLNRFYTDFGRMPTTLTKRVVWVVDDSPLDAERTCGVLSQECTVEVFLDGSAALERLASAAPPDVMVLDWVMPGVTGVEVCRFLRSERGGYPEVGVLLLTTHRHTEQIVEGLSAGANDYLAKPYADAELLARVRSLLRSRQLLERAEQAEALSVSLLKMAPDALIALDEARTIKFVNETARLTLRDQPALQVGRPFADFLPELDRQLQSAASLETLQLPDVKVGDQLFSPTLRLLPASKLFSTILSLRDVTESRRLDARRLDLYSIIAHDLRTPLSAITLRTQLILQGRHGALPSGLETDVHKIEGNLKSLVEMINDFLELASLDKVRYDMRRDELAIGELLAETIEDLRPQLDAHALRWVNKGSEPLTVWGDRSRLRQVLTNLISNATKFTADQGTITTSVVRCGDEVEVSVEDTGRGIAEQNLATIFERFTRANDPHDKVPGSGLGLMIVREIIEAHGGKLGVESKLGVGSRFWFRLQGVNRSPQA